MPRNVSSNSFDDCLRALEHERRRAVIAALVDTDSLGTASLGEDERTRLSLLHHHLPVLAEKGYVDWDRDAGRVRRGPRFDDVDAVLSLLLTHEDDLPWTIV